MTNKTTSAIDLVERLRRTEKRKSYVTTNRTAPIIESEYDAPINPDGPEAADTITRLQAALKQREADTLNDIAVMMSEFVDNWPQPKRVETAFALIAKTLREALHGA